MIRRFDAVIVGAGAAGLMCAIEAGKRGRRVAVLEHAEGVGKKILISGGGRCNFTNIYSSPDNFLSANPHFAKSALARYTPADFVTLVEAYGIPYHEKTLGQLFCDRTARDIIHMLEEECRRAGVTIFLKTSVREVRRTTEFVLDTGTEEFRASVLVVATGGLSIPKMGATGFGYGVARQFGLKIRECRPALVPFTFGREDRGRYSSLAGVSCEVVASIGKQRFREKMLFTHRGLSGPAILQISSYWTQGQPIMIDLAPGGDFTPALLEKSHRDTGAAKSVLRGMVPARLAELWMDLNAPARWTNPAILELERRLHHWQVIPAGTEGYEKAEVTAGGVDTNELSAKTMECRKQTGLYFIGEVVDVTGHLGGFNFQWAWASGACAGRAL
ncbi:MAG TPA: NAD(P)/FAD-dependent oxidoreductase [Bryobacteraceae bacterium]|nr:NAD(P)/FAD-dependent oxidoreductase [Bryobacteraceae bacterium]